MLKRRVGRGHREVARCEGLEGRGKEDLKGDVAMGDGGGKGRETKG